MWLPNIINNKEANDCEKELNEKYKNESSSEGKCIFYPAYHIDLYKY